MADDDYRPHADQVGLTNGQAIGIAELPNSFVQGAAYVGSFTVGRTIATKLGSLTSISARWTPKAVW
jgi:hypothetical protein